MKIGYFLSCEEWGPRDLWANEALPGELYVNQIGPGQDAFFEAYRDRVLPGGVRPRRRRRGVAGVER
jgi:hypothetical protein